MDQLQQDISKQAREADRFDKNLAEDLKPLLKSPAWEAMQRLLNKKIEGLGAQLIAPNTDIGGVIHDQYLKGTMYGLILCRDLPGAIVEAMKAEAIPQEDEDDAT